jgi:prevent-host-death family protein
MKATAKDLRFHSKEILDSVMRGEEVVITYRGKPSAKIIPVKKRKSNLDVEHQLFGIWANYNQTQDVAEYVRNIREGRSHDS